MRYISFIITLLITGNILAGSNRLKDDQKLKERAGRWMKAVPVKFLENKGQMTDINGAPVPFVLFKIEGNNANIYITEQGLTYVFIKSEEDDEHEEEKNKLANYSRIDMDLKNASIKKENIIKEGPSEANFNYFFGHCPQGIYGVKQYEKITIKNIYPHIDWTLYNSNSNGFKYDFIVHPGADPGQIELVYSSLNPLKLNRNGNIEIKTESGSLTENNPVSFQNKINIETKFIKTLNRRNIHNGYDTHIKFSLENYDKTQTLIIDPQLFWGTYYGGNGLDNFCNVSTDIYGNVLVTGYTGSFNYFPTKSSGTAYYQSVMPNSSSVPIAKFTNNGVLLWATLYAGGTCGSYAIDGGTCIDSDPSGNIYVTGITTCAAFPTQNMAGAYFQAPAAGVSRPFILKFDNSGNRLWATTFGGSLSGPTGPGAGNSKYLALDATGNLFLCGYGLNGLPTANPGGGAYTQAAGGGYDMFFSKFSPAGVLTWSTYFGGSGYEAANAITIDNSNNLIATGYTESANLPLASPGGSAYTDNTYNGSGDAALVKFSNNGNLLWSTYFGGSAFDAGYAVDCDATGNIYTTGETASAAFPAQNPGAGAYFDNTFNGVVDIYVAKFLNNNSLFWSTYYGGTAGEGAATGQGAKPLSMSYGKMGIVADNCGNVYATGSTGSSDFPVFNNTACSSFYSSTFGGAFILKFNSLGVRTWATFCGPSASFGSGIATDIYNNIFAVGEWWWSSTSISNTLLNPGGGAYFQATPNGPIGSDDGFVIKFIPDPPSHTQSHVNPGSCICNGSTTVNITSVCSTPPYNYVWSNGTQILNTASATSTITGLCPGNYSVTITDAACNRDTISYMLVGAGGSISLAATQKNISCGSSCDGNANVLPSGGVAPYTYSWSGPGAQTTQTISGLCAGTYSVTVKDANSCTSIYNFSITQIPFITLSVSSTPSCSGATATANVINGVPPYIYTWSNAQTTQTATGLNTGNYTVTVYDANGICSASTSVTVQGKPALSTSSTNFSCTTSGYAQVWAVNGVPTNNVNPLPYTYTWSSGETTYNISPTSAGNYTVTVNDGNGCTVTQTFSITGTNPLSVSFTSSSACIGTPVTFTNTGTPPGTGVTYIWRISPNPNTGTITSGTTTNFSYTFLTAGSYTITHQVDSGGCTRTTSKNITVTNCTGPTITATGSSVCPGACATAAANSSGGTGPYTYSWSTGATTQNINPCPASTTTYTVKVTDSGGNTATTTTTVTIKPPLTISSTQTDIVCSGGTGSATALGGNGNPPYTYNWSNGQTNQNSTGLSAGNYTVTATDATGCSASSTVVINSPLPLAGQFSTGTANCTACGCKEWIIVNATGGTSPYSYSWPDGYVNRYKNQLCPGAYTIKIVDKNGCSTNLIVNAP